LVECSFCCAESTGCNSDECACKCHTEDESEGTPCEHCKRIFHDGEWKTIEEIENSLKDYEGEKEDA